ncbi:hypothetical protein WISP_16962 [Willisornis vidua]|uniref:Uncharacterized protein n=1 Tax=Willisornis vidua TaxID=1566151 RepID=A0ABQ9DQY7_9PASS|nr:hypothetical protein WISP_16962 [Willisornis vidua]
MPGSRPYEKVYTPDSWTMWKQGVLPCIRDLESRERAGLGTAQCFSSEVLNNCKEEKGLSNFILLIVFLGGVEAINRDGECDVILPSACGIDEEKLYRRQTDTSHDVKIVVVLLPIHRRYQGDKHVYEYCFMVGYGLPVVSGPEVEEHFEP